MQRNRMRIGLGRGVFLVLLAVVILALAGELGVSRELPRTIASQSATLATPGATGTNLFITFDGIPGECTEKEHTGWSNALSFSQGVTQAASAHIATGAGAGAADLEDVIVIKPLDKASPSLAQACYRGTVVRSVK
ncbi:MAG: type VI secretion system tube protein Hcp, partial [Phycisphaerales bacterium]